MDQKKISELTNVQLTDGNTSEEEKLGPYVINDSGLVFFESKLSESSWVNHGKKRKGVLGPGEEKGKRREQVVRPGELVMRAPRWSNFIDHVHISSAAALYYVLLIIAKCIALHTLRFPKVNGQRFEAKRRGIPSLNALTPS
jgi:hypothetical protein